MKQLNGCNARLLVNDFFHFKIAAKIHCSEQLKILLTNTWRGVM